MNPDWRARYETAVEATAEAGRAALRYFDAGTAVEWKQDRSPVTAADREAEALLRGRLLGAFPDDDFLGEESGEARGSSGFRWIIDPVDGTRFFVRGIPLWSTLVGLEYRGEVIAGVVAFPALGLTYRALRGDGAFRGERRIHVSDVADLAAAQLFYTSIAWFTAPGSRAGFDRLAAATLPPRGLGEAYGYMLVAQGSGELMVEHGTSAWDIAAPRAVLEEAGGRLTAWDGTTDLRRPDAVASNGRLHDPAVHLLQGTAG